MRRREFIAGLGGAVSWPIAARAQQPALPVIGYLFAGPPDHDSFIINSIRKGLSDSGFAEGHNITMEYRWADDQLDRLPSLAAELARRQVAVIVAPASTASALAAKAATRTIPIVFLIGSHPVEIGLVASFNRPAGNVTGVAMLAGEIAAKRLELLHRLIPAAPSIAMLVNPTNPNYKQAETNDIQSAARVLGVRLLVLDAANPNEVTTAFRTIVEQQIGALLIGGDVFFVTRHDQIVSLAARYAIPTMFFDSASVAAGGLVSYGPDLPDAFHQVGLYTGRVLKGEKPADLPVVQPTKFELVLNLKTAKALGLELPPTLLALTDRVIE